MIAKRLEGFLRTTVPQSSTDIVQRFQELRKFNLLPKSRGRSAEHLSDQEIVAGIMSTICDRPGYAGITTKILLDLLPVGGASASFYGADNLRDALILLFHDDVALQSVLEIRISDSEVGKNGHGRAAIIYLKENQEITAYYVRKEAASLLGPGAEKEYNPRASYLSAISERVFFSRVFKLLAKELKQEREHMEIMSKFTKGS
ncbi:MAG: hypothetical protein GKS01_07430 [Alphaproteobacteria bacterium]|nr:hypothetical protein [Alphaproteobacteria bacterium]